MKHVIIGAGIAGVSAAQTIKKIDRNAEVVLIGEERYFPYKRYLLSDFITGTIENEEIFYTSAEFFDEKGIKLRKSERVKSINTDEKSIKFFHNEVMLYDKLLIATGGCPAFGPVLRRYQKNVQSYYSLKDILLIKRKLPLIKDVIVFGEGLSHLDLMCSMKNLGKNVTYIVKGDQAEFPAVASEFEMTLHEFLLSKGIIVLPNDRVVAIKSHEKKYQVLTLNEKKLFADIVFAWDYYKPSIDCIENTKIEKKIGILVDQQLRTSVDDVYAAGDCVEIYHPNIKDYWINFGWPNAAAQGEIVGKNMTGLNVEYEIHETIPFNLMGKALKARWWE
jgi:NADPH-dependent 2,4-dienoyl-CoA reductase/sulfur reductase-like enzyme